MKNECNNIHLPNYKSACCLRHLIEMAKYAEMQTLIKKYSKFLLVTLNHNYKAGRLQYSTIKLDLFLAFNDVITKYMSHFFIINKPDYAKLLGSIGMKAFKETAFKENPEVILRKVSIHNNISCVYEAKGNYANAYYYLSKNRQFISLSSNLDNAILYNNLIRYCFKLNKQDEINEIVIQLNEALNEELKNAKVFSMKQTKEITSSNMKANFLIKKELYEKNQLISFLLLNFNMILDKLGKKAEAKEMLTKGYEFSMSVLGEYHFYTQKFVHQININKLMLYKFDSDSNENYYNSSCDKKKFMKKTNKSFDSVIRFQIEQKERESMINDEYKKKLDYIYEYIISQSRNQSNNGGTEQKHSQSETEPSLTHIVRKEKKAYNHFKTVLKPLVRKWIDSNMTSDIKKPIAKKSKKEIIEEFMQESKANGEFKRKFNHKTEENKVEEPKKKTDISQSSELNTQANKPPRIKALFSKVIDVNRPVQPEKKFQQLINQLRNDSDDFSTSTNKKLSLNDQSNATQPLQLDDNIHYNSNNKNLADSLNVNNTNSNSNLITDRNMIKSELEHMMKDISVKINLDQEDDNFEFKPFYQTNKTGNAVEENKNYFVNQKQTKFIKQSNKAPEDSFLNSIMHANQINPSPQAQSHNNKEKTETKFQLPTFEFKLEEEEVPFEFVPFYSKNTSATIPSDKPNEVSQKNVKFLRGKKQDTSMTDFINQSNKTNTIPGTNYNYNSNLNSNTKQIEDPPALTINIDYLKKESEFEFKPYYWKNQKYKGDNRVIEVHQKKNIKIFGNNEGENEDNDAINDQFPEMIVAYDKEEKEYEFLPFYVHTEEIDPKQQKQCETYDNLTGTKRKLVFYVIKDLLNKNDISDDGSLPKINMKLSKDESLYEFKPFYAANTNIGSMNTKTSTPIMHRQVKIAYTINDDEQDNLNSDLTHFHQFNIQSSSSSLDIDVNSQSPKLFENLLIDPDRLILNEETIQCNNYLDSKAKSTIDTSEYFNQLLLKSSTQSSFCITTLSLYKGQYYKIIITQTKDSFILFKSFNPLKPNETLSELSTNSIKLKTILHKVYLFNALPKYIGLSQLPSFEDLIMNTIIFHCNIIQEDGKYCIGISPKPNSLYGDKQIQYKFLKVYCIIEIMVIQINQLRVIITNKQNKESSFSIDCICDESSFKDLVTEIPNQLPMIENEIYIPAYKFNDKQMGKNGFIIVLIKRTQEIIHLKSNDKDLTFDSIQKDLHSYFFQCSVKSNCTKVTFSDLTFDSMNNSYTINEYTFPMIKGRETTSVTYLIGLNDINNIFNCNNDIREFNHLYKLLNERDRTITLYFIMNTYNQTPLSLFSYKTILDKETNAVMSLQLLSYSKELFFTKIIYYDPITHYEFSLIYLPQKGFEASYYLSKCKSHQKNFKIILEKIYKDDIQSENIQMIKYYPMSILFNNIQ